MLEVNDQGRETEIQRGSKKRYDNTIGLIIIFILDKERYDKELKSLESYSTHLKKPKKCLSAYMIFVKEVHLII